MGMMNGAEDLNVSENASGCDDVEDSIGFLSDLICVVMKKRGVLRVNVGKRDCEGDAVETWV